MLGQDITVCADHENLAHEVFNTERVMRWHLLVEEFGPKLVYVKGDKNIVADALSRLHMKPAPKSQSNESVLDEPDHRLLAESFLEEEIADDLPDWKMCVPTSLQTRMVQWHHEQLCHAGETCTLEKINQHFYWKNMRNAVKHACSKCNLCQRTKRSQSK